MAQDDEILLRFKADLEQMKGDIKKMAHDSDTALKGMAKTSEDTNKKLQGIGDTVKGKMSSAFTNLKGTIAGAFAVHSLIQFTEKLFEMQDALEAIDRKSTAVFKNTLPEMQREAEKTANSIGLTKSEYLDAASAITTYLKNTGFTTEESAKLSKQLLDTSSKLSLVNTEGLSAKDIALQLAGSFNGQTRSLKSLGFNIKLTKDEMSQLGDETEVSSSATQKKSTALKVMNSIMEQSTGIVGDLNDEMFKSESAERESEARLREQMDELARKSEALKEFVLSLKIGFVDFFNTLTKGFGRAKQDFDAFMGNTILNAEQTEFVSESRGLAETQRINSLNSTYKKYAEFIQQKQIPNEEAILILRKKLDESNEKLKKSQEELTDTWGSDSRDLQRSTVALYKGGVDGIQRLITELTEQKKVAEDTSKVQVSQEQIIENQNKAIQEQNDLLEKRKSILEKTSKDVDEVFKERQSRNEQSAKDFGSIAEQNRSEFNFGTPSTAEETPDATSLQLEQQASRVEALQEVYSGLFDSIQEGWMTAVRASGASERQMVILEKGLAFGKILLDYAVARFKITAQFSAMLANPLTAAAAPAFRATALTSLNQGLGLNLAALAAVAIPQIAFANNKFARGVEFLSGSGTSTSDSIPAMLSNGERVVTADKNRKYWDELSAIHNNHFEDLITTKYVVPAIQTMLNETSTGERLAAGIMLQKWKGENIVSELWKTRVADKKHNKDLIDAIKPKRVSKRSW